MPVVGAVTALTLQGGHPEVAALRGQLQIVLAQINLHEQCMVECEQQLQRWHADDASVRRLDEVSGIGVLTASALKTAVGQPERFASGRQLSAWAGMSPREFRAPSAPTQGFGGPAGWVGMERRA